MCSGSHLLCWFGSWPRRNEQNNNNNIRRSFPCWKPFTRTPTERKTGGEPAVWSEVYPHPESETCLPSFSWRAGPLLSMWPWWTTATALLWGLWIVTEHLCIHEHCLKAFFLQPSFHSSSPRLTSVWTRFTLSDKNGVSKTMSKGNVPSSPSSGWRIRS